MNRSEIVPPLRLCFFMWLIFTIGFYFKLDFGFLGIHPLHLRGLIGVFTAPLIHGNFQHLLSNTLPLLILGVSLFFFYPRVAERVFLYGYFFTNLLVWFFGRPFYHIGASGLIYALASFLVLYGVFKQNFKTLLISAIVIFMYGGMTYSVFSFDERISWESHLMGAIVGGVSAFILAQNPRK